MGLDMYLYATDYISGDEIVRLGESFTHKPNKAFDDTIEALGIERSDLDADYPAINIAFKVLQWRKANQIHNWFVENVQRGEDDCRDYYVSRDKLHELHDRLGEALAIKNGTANGDPDITIEDILPTQGGFFFGSTEYDDYYWEDVQYTHDRLTEILNNPKFEKYGFEYRSSW